MAPLEGRLLEGRPPRYVQVPTAAALEGRDRLRYWVELGRVQADRLGVQAVTIPAADRQDADDPKLAQMVEGAGLIYLSGGSPRHLVSSLRGSRLWAAIVDCWRQGAALAGCSAGAMALGDRLVDIRRPSRATGAGLGLLRGVSVLAHFDRLAGRVPEALLTGITPSTGGTMLGIDEDTALVGAPGAWFVEGRQAVWVLGGGRREGYRAGDQVVLPAVEIAEAPAIRGQAQVALDDQVVKEDSPWTR